MNGHPAFQKVARDKYKRIAIDKQKVVIQKNMRKEQKAAIAATIEFLRDICDTEVGNEISPAGV